MPVDEIFDLDLESDTTNLDKLDRMAAKSVRSLEKQRKALDAAQKQQEVGGGIFKTANVPTGKGGPKDIQPLSKRDQQIEKKMRKLTDKMDKDEVKNFGKKSNFLDGILGPKTAKNIIEAGKDPVKFFTGVAKAIPFLGGVFAAKQIVDFISDELVKLDAFFKKFIDRVDERINKFRDLQDQAEIQAGLQQRILTTSFGSLDPRTSYNTFHIFERNQAEIEGEYELTNTTGVE